MFQEGQRIKIKVGTYACLDDAITEYEVASYSGEEVTVIEDISDEKIIIVNISKNRTPYRVIVPHSQIA